MTSAGTARYSDGSAFIMRTVSLDACEMINSRLGKEVFLMTSWHDAWFLCASAIVVF